MVTIPRRIVVLSCTPTRWVLLFASLLALGGCEAMMYKPFAPGNVFNRDGNFLQGTPAPADVPSYRPIVDEASIVKPERYENDVYNCQQYAGNISPGGAAVQGAVGGAIVGALIGAAIGDRKSFARYGAGVGAVHGAVNAGVSAQITQAQIIRNCMAGRGYVVLDGPTSVPIGATNAVESAPPPPGNEQQQSFVNVPCDVVKDEYKEQCARDHEQRN